MRIFHIAAAAALIVCGAAQADELPGAPPGADQATVSVGMICNTPQQAERYVALRATGTELAPAMARVNREAKDPRACGVAAIAFIPDKTLANKAVGGKLLQVVRVNIIAGFNGAGWQAVTGMVQYAVLRASGETI